MKKFCIAVCILFLGISVAQSQVLLARWTFPTGNASDSIADGGIAANLNKAIHTEGGTSAIDFSKNGYTTKAAQATGWDNGADLKCWIVEITTANYENLKISSRQQSGGNNPGPRDWKVQYRPGLTGTWTDVPNTTLNVQNDWTTGVLDSVDLPESCENQASLFVRWIMTSNTNSNGSPVASNGIDKIDDIIFTGKQMNTAVPGPSGIRILRVFPNPAHERITVQSDFPVTKLTLMDLAGKVIVSYSQASQDQILDVSRLRPGYYQLSVQSPSFPDPVIRKIIIL